MGMNDDGLSPREHAEMRDLVLAGTQRIKPAGTHRNQVIAGALALVLVGAVTGAAITTAAIFGTDTTTATTPTPSPTRTATAVPAPAPAVTSTPLPLPPEGVVPFSGSCGNALLDDEVDALRGIGMTRSDYRWQSGAREVLGGIDCLWLSDEGYAEATLHVYAYPETSVPASVRDMTPTGCRPLEWSDSDVECSASGVVDGTWLLVRAVGSGQQISESGVAALYAGAASRLTTHPAAVAAARTADWWALPDCASIVSQTDPAVYGFERVADADDGGSGVASDRPEAIPTLAGASGACALHFTSGSGESVTGQVVTVEFVPGGAPYFPTAVAAAESVAVAVDGAVDAVWVPGLDRYEGSWEALVVTDGMHVLIVSPNDPVEAEAVAPLASALLSLL